MRSSIKIIVGSDEKTRLTDVEVVAIEILDKWFSTQYEPNEGDDACLAVVEELEMLHRHHEIKSTD